MSDGATAASDALTGPAVAGITRLSAVETVRARIALSIELGLLSPGEQLPSDAEVASALDVSEITARRGLKSLAEDGLLRRVRGRSGGTFVADHPEPAAIHADAAVAAYRADAAEVHRLIDQRIALETSMAHFAALNATDDDLAELDTAVTAAQSAQNWTDYHAADERFHLGVARACGREWMLPLYRDTLQRLYAYFVPYPIEYLHGVNDEHRALVDALRRRDPVAAVDISEKHVAVLHETMFVGL